MVGNCVCAFLCGRSSIYLENYLYPFCDDDNNNKKHFIIYIYDRGCRQTRIRASTKWRRERKILARISRSRKLKMKGQRTRYPAARKPQHRRQQSKVNKMRRAWGSTFRICREQFGRSRSNRRRNPSALAPIKWYNIFSRKDTSSMYF